MVNVFVMGANKWLRGATYPLETTQYQKLFLTSGGQANTSHGDGGVDHRFGRQTEKCETEK